MKKCSVETCSQPLYARTWCRAHYKRWQKSGDIRVDEPLGRYGSAQVERAAAKIRGRKYGPRPEQWGRNISAAKKGKSNGLEGSFRTAETRKKISVANSGPLNGFWKGDDVGYVALHERMRKILPSECLHCGSRNRLHAALKRDATGPIKIAVMKVSGKDREICYSTAETDYIRLCATCHKKYDNLAWG